MKLTNQQINFLEHNGWSTCYINGILEISNSETGCRLSSPLSNDFAEQFAIEKIEELLEDLENDEIKLDISEEQILEEAGYTIMCESPFELEDEKGAIVTGECANWLQSTLVQNYKESLKMCR